MEPNQAQRFYSPSSSALGSVCAHPLPQQPQLTDVVFCFLVLLSSEIVEALQENVTQLLHQTASSLSLKVAAESQMLAAQSQNKACESSQQFLQKQL